jgi:hypothetical protein
MSWANPKEHYETLIEKAAGYTIKRHESGCRFRSTAAAVNFSLPDSNADANVIGGEVEVECKDHEDTVTVTGLVDKIYYNGAVITKIYLKHENDLVRIHCTEAGVWLITGFTGAPTLDNGSTLKPLSWDPVEYSVATTVGWEHHGKTLMAIAGGDPTVVFTLPDTATSDGLWVRIMQLSQDPQIDVAAASGDVFRQPNSSLATVDSLVPASRGVPYAFVEIRGDAANSTWLIVGGSAVWEDAAAATDRFVLGCIAGADGHSASFDANGQLKDSGAAVDHATRHLSGGGDVMNNYRSVFIPIASMLDGNSPPAAASTVAPGGAGATGRVSVRDFDAASVETLVFPWEVPSDWNGELYYQVVGWITSATAPIANEGVAFSLAGFSLGQGDAINGAFGAAVMSKIADLGGAGVNAQYDRFITALSAAVTVTDILARETAMIRVQREVGEVEDDYAQDVGVAGVVLYYKAMPVGMPS